MSDYWGYHLRINAGNCNRAAITDAQVVADFTRALVERIDMVAYGEPQIVHFGEGNKAGFTLIQLIETSNIAAHFCNDTGDVYLDVFSCKEFSNEAVVDCFLEFFDAATLEFDFTERQAPQS